VTSHANPFRRILVPLDGSAHADAAFDLALVLARDGKAEVVCCNAVDVRFIISESYAGGYVCDPTPIVDALRGEGEALLAAAARRATIAGVKLTTCVTVDTADSAILAAARSYESDLIVMGTQGKSGLEYLFLGSTTESVLRTSSVPVMTIRAEAARATRPQSHPFARALVACDDSAPSDAAVELAIAFAEREDVRLVFCTVTAAADIVAPSRDRARSRVLEAKRCVVEAEETSVDGEPVEEILKAASAARADVIVLGSHGRRGLDRFFLGSVAEHVVRRSAVPVLVVRCVRRPASAATLAAARA
jgi:nucleotide-binding universal stress UspA family protein